MNLSAMEQLAVDLRRPARRYEPITDYVAPDVPDSVFELMAMESGRWSRMTGELKGPTNLVGNIAGIEGNAAILSGGLAALTTSTSEQALYAAATYTPIAAGITGPKMFEFLLAMSITTGTTAGGLTFTPRFGTSTSGNALGASVATTNTVSITGALLAIRGEMIVTPGTTAGATARVYFTGKIEGRLSAAGPGAKTEDQIFGGTVVTTGDLSTAQALWMGVTNSSATTPPTITVQMLRWGSWS